jgi:hypothetical protein
VRYLIKRTLIWKDYILDDEKRSIGRYGELILFTKTRDSGAGELTELLLMMLLLFLMLIVVKSLFEILF